MITLKLPESLQRFAAEPQIKIEIQKLSELPYFLKKNHQKLYSIIFNETGELAEFLNLYLDQQHITHLENPRDITGNHTLEIVTAFSGG